jgi:hypothetical protein
VLGLVGRANEHRPPQISFVLGGITLLPGVSLWSIWI